MTYELIMERYAAIGTDLFGIYLAFVLLGFLAACGLAQVNPGKARGFFLVAIALAVPFAGLSPLAPWLATAFLALLAISFLGSLLLFRETAR